MIVVEGKSLQTLPLKEMLTAVFLFLSKGFIIAGGALPYVFQYIEIQKRKTAAGFSLLVCLTLCVANILRLFFRVGKTFGLELVIQSIVMIICMIVMLEISVRMNRSLVSPAQRTSILKGDFFRAFWKWNDLKSYMISLLGFTIIMALLTALFVQYPLYVESLGILALGTEALLGIPQLIRNFTRGSTQGMSLGMVIAWFIGDVFKTGWFIVQGEPVQFYVCSSLQVTVDMLILAQVIYYGWFLKRGSRRAQSYLPDRLYDNPPGGKSPSSDPSGLHIPQAYKLAKGDDSPGGQIPQDYKSPRDDHSPGLQIRQAYKLAKGIAREQEDDSPGGQTPQACKFPRGMIRPHIIYGH